MASTAQDIMDRYGLDQDFAVSIESLGNDIGVDPMYLANVMYAESRLDPSMKNMAGSGATGLIQFMPTTAKDLGTTTDELSRMTSLEQMEYVRKYFSADNLGAGRLRALQKDPSQHNVNMAVFLPSMIGKPVDTQIPQKYWRQNGSIRTPADYSQAAEKRVNEFVQSSPTDTQTDQMLSEEQPEGTFRPEDDAVPSDTGPASSDQVEEEPGFLDTVGEYAGDAYDTASEYVGETVDTLERVAENVGQKLRRLLGSEEEQQSSTTVDNPPIPERRPVMIDNPPIPKLRPDQTEEAFTDVENFVDTLKKAEGGSVEKKAEFIKKKDDDVPDPPPGATPEEVADDIPAYLSTGEYVLPANVVRYIGLKNITDMHQRALSELQQMEDLDIIENVDENGYVEEDDDEMDYMEPKGAGVVEVVVAEHHPKGLMSVGFAEGGLVEAMVYVPGVGFVPQTRSPYLSVTKDEDKKTEEQEDTDKSILEGGESQGDTNDVSEGGPTGAGYESFSEMISDPSFQSQAKEVLGLFGSPLAANIAKGTIKGFKEEFGFDDAPSPGETFGGDVESEDIGGTEAAAQAAAASQMDAQAAENEAEAAEAAEAEAEAAEAAEAEAAAAEAEAAGARRGGYVTRNGIMAKGYSKGGSVDSAPLTLSSIFTPGFLKTAGLMGDPNKKR